MAVKKKVGAKKSTEKHPQGKEESPPDKTPVIRQVVEEVDNPKILEDRSEALEEIKEDAEHIEEVAENLKDQETLVSSEEQNESEVKSEQTHDVVSEIYKPKAREFTPEIAVEKKGSTRSLLIWAIIVLAVALVTGGMLIKFLGGGFKAISFPGKSTPTPTPTFTPAPTPTPSVLNRQDLKIQVLNGGGKVGAGSAMKTFLEEKGYTVSDVSNADKFTYEKTEIMVKADKKDYLTLLEEDLKDKYTVGNSSSDLADEVSYDAQVIVGKE